MQKESKNQTTGRSGPERNHVTVESFACYQDRTTKRDKKLEVQVFLVCLLELLSFVGLSCFRLLEVSALGLTIGLTIGGAESISGKVAVGLSRWSRWKVLLSLQRCSIAEAGS